jgi:hypothetical protein
MKHTPERCPPHRLFIAQIDGQPLRDDEIVFCQRCYMVWHIKDVMELINARAGINSEAVPLMKEALEGLLDGLDANVDGRDGLSTERWEKRIAHARAALAKMEKRS